jgi:tetratricopeptide (TPR) repeat protein
MKKSFALLLVLTLSACVTEKKKAIENKDADKQPVFDQGMKALEGENYSEAARIFDKLLVQKPGLEMDVVTLYNSGAAYEGLGDCQKASDRYRQAVRSSAGKFKRIEGEALFRLSLQYECLGQDAKTVSSLLDAKKRAKDLPFETINAEVPARMAAAYARLGNRAKAVEYFTQASRGLKGLVSRGATSTAQKETIARTLFLMGQLSPNQRRAEAQPMGYLQSLSMQQPFLLQAMEMNHTHWSAKAESDLKLAYDNIWKFQIKDPHQQREFFTRSLQTVSELRKIRLPSNDPRIEGMFASLDQTETQLQTALSNGKK